MGMSCPDLIFTALHGRVLRHGLIREVVYLIEVLNSCPLKKGLIAVLSAQGSIGITEQQLGQTASVLYSHCYQKLARLEGLEPPSSPSTEYRLEVCCFLQLSYRRKGKGSKLTLKGAMP